MHTLASPTVKRKVYTVVTKVRLGRATPDARRAEIIEIATAVFMVRGYADTAMSMIAERLGGSKATLYKYFPSKEELFEAVMAQSCAVVLEPLRDIATSEGEIGEVLRIFGRALMSAIFQPSALALYRIVHAEGERFPQLANMFFTRGPDEGYAVLAEYLQRLHERGEIRCPEPWLTAQQIAGMFRGDLHTRVACGAADVPDDRQIEASVENAVRICLSGLLADSRPGRRE